jgi:hypothetical protein
MRTSKNDKRPTRNCHHEPRCRIEQSCEEKSYALPAGKEPPTCDSPLSNNAKSPTSKTSEDEGPQYEPAISRTECKDGIDGI